MGKELPTYAELTVMPLTSDWPDLAPADQFRDRGVHILSFGEVMAGQLILSGERIPSEIIVYCQGLLGRTGYYREAFDATVRAWNESSTNIRKESSQNIFNAVAVQLASAFHASQTQLVEYTTIFSKAVYQMKAMAEAATPA